MSAAGLDVGFLCQGWTPAPGGVEAHSADLAEELARRGHRVHVLCLDGDPELEPFTVRTAATAFGSVRRLAYRYHDMDSITGFARNVNAERAVLDWLGETPCDVVHVHHATGFAAGALEAIADLGRPLVVTLHDYWLLCPRGQLLRAGAREAGAFGDVCARPEPAVCGPCLATTWPHLALGARASVPGPNGERLLDDASAAGGRTEFALAVLARADARVAPSEPVRSVYAAAGVPSEAIRVIEHGLDGERLRDAVARARGERPAREARARRIGVLGAVQPSKGALEFARAFLAADLPGWSLELHGPTDPYHGDGSYVEELRRLAATSDRVRLCGPYERAGLALLLSELDAVALPARWEEPFGLSAREARAAGLPLLVARRGGLPGAVRDGATGLLVEGDTPAAWTAALERFAADHDALAAAARADALAAGAGVRTRAAMVDDYEALYADVIRAGVGESAPREASSGGWWSRLFGRR